MDGVGLFSQEIESIFDKAKPLVEERWAEFEILGKKGSEEDLFLELSFCVLTANWTARGGIKAQKEIGSGFIRFSEEELEEALRKVGHRFPKARAKYIVENRWIIGKLRKIINLPLFEAREFLVKNVMGIGWKEASHFLRNAGFCDIAILDKHILKLMKKFRLINEIPKGWSKKKYLMYEEKLRGVSNKLGECLGKLDLYLWYYVKGQVDK
ncbi:N-glycosylase/DNA lyase [Thermosipho ferrireducens]|uniref:8-oxoguanine DNA glycosylase/AP lyase n=1 Tax=Thermosipho ferrireducens TaxID=2571116 RepID=A0ABX7S5E3_9BACT|nr:N-glycosylase/DNA lyase [Thermosipho ferrireducens]QTA37752.1 N-glycosylase/DNA lyase [Thermosipho ferrireducens]